MFNHHTDGIGNINTHLHNTGGHKDVNFSTCKLGHPFPLFFFINPGMNQDQFFIRKNCKHIPGLETPVVVAGGIVGFAQAEAILAAGQADIVAAARQTLADPDWFEKVRRGRGAEVRRCELTNYCEALDQRHRQVTCKLWDRLDRDRPGVASGLVGGLAMANPKSLSSLETPCRAIERFHSA